MGYLALSVYDFRQRSSVLGIGRPSVFPVETSVQLMLMLELYESSRGRFSTEPTLVWGGNLILAGLFSPWEDIPK